jgi:hypothetical protein
MEIEAPFAGQLSSPRTSQERPRLTATSYHAF